MSETTKPLSEYDQTQILQKVYNPVDGTLAVNGFLAGKIGHKVVRTPSSATVDVFSFYDNASLLYEITVTYDNSDHDNVNEAERTA